MQLHVRKPIVRLKHCLARLLCLASLVTVTLKPSTAHAYSLLTHEELIDLTWQSSIVPLLLSRYPDLTPEQLEHARAYAYGGCVIQDIGYYPLGDLFFSDLTHYVRSGDFVVNLFRNAGNADELAFAVGALSHYIGDSVGHSTATNLAVPVEFPKLRDKYGNVVSYAEGEHQHVQTEFAFDINDIAHHRLAPVHYLRHVGLDVPTKQLALAFYQTYGLSEDFTLHRKHRINVGAYRFAVHGFIPRIAYALTLLHRKHEPTDISTPEFQQLQREIATIEQQNQWDEYRRKAGIGTYTLAGVLFILPKFGPLKLVAIKGPTEKTEADYIHSVVQSEDQLRYALHRFTPPPTTKSTAQSAAAADTHSDPPPSAPALAKVGASQNIPRDSPDPHHPLKNRDLDTGNPVKPAGYRLTDDTYASLLHRLAAHPEQPIPPGVKDDVLAYYSNLDLPFATRKNPLAWATLQTDLNTFRAMPTSTDPEPYPTYGEGDSGDSSSAPAPGK
ncbi:MAG TPA: zinc dependent phospholipase C family protein [Acidobacteriaceae bacterium]|nr:zinc dependent phospholipase C family protein [Acidobacteriaceae bacterium]